MRNEGPPATSKRAPASEPASIREILEADRVARAIARELVAKQPVAVRVGMGIS